MTLKEKLAAIHKEGKTQNKSDDFMAQVILFWFEWDLEMSLTGNGWLDDDQETLDALRENEEKIAEFTSFLKKAGLKSIYY